MRHLMNSKTAARRTMSISVGSVLPVDACTDV